MSGITPILDTLLHQVLGKRVETAPQRQLTGPVRPASPGDAVQALRSDSRLQPRAPLPQAPAGAARVGSGEAQSAPVVTDGGAPPGPASAAVLTHFSAAARAIADLLLRYPAPPSAIRPPAPLLPAAGGGVPEQLARQLRASVDSSGLFYESHLERWYRGERDIGQLSREPQMRLTGAGIPGESLQGLLRHQLEMLAFPVLRWEGEVWPGMTMALLLQMPAQGSGREGGESTGDGRERQGEDNWHSRLTLHPQGLGEIQVQLALCGGRLQLALAAASGELAARLDESAGPLRERLGELGFDEVLLTVDTGA